MVAILAMEAEEENLSEERKLSLGQEVYSLQLVVEMRSSEVRSLRQQLALSTQQLEEMEATKVLLGKATARMDDLQAQLAEKARVGRQLSIEKTQLEMTVTSSNKAVERMSQNVEELQWRIRNNFDLPIVHHSNSREDQPTSLPVCMPESPVMMRTRPSLPDIPRTNVLLDFVTSEMLPGTETGAARADGDTSDFDFSPLTPSDQRVAVGEQESNSNVSTGDHEEEEEEGEDEYGGGEGDACSLDEGLGDLSDSDVADGPLKDSVIIMRRELSLESVVLLEETSLVSKEDAQIEKEEAPPLPQAPPPVSEEKERKASRIPRMIQCSNQQKNTGTSNEFVEPEKGSTEAEGTAEKSQEVKDRAFSPERRPSRISFETML